MRRKAVDSGTVASIGYEPRRCELDVEFRESGDVYRYFGVSAEEHAAFMAAESKGTHLNQVFKAKRHPYRLVKRGRKQLRRDV
jgi:KTSC domain